MLQKRFISSLLQIGQPSAHNALSNAIVSLGSGNTGVSICRTAMVCFPCYKHFLPQNNIFIHKKKSFQRCLHSYNNQHKLKNHFSIYRMCVHDYTVLNMCQHYIHTLHRNTYITLHCYSYTLINYCIMSKE